MAGLAVDADVRDASAGADQLGRELERLRYADRFEGDVRAEAVGQLHHACDGVLAAVVDRDVGAEPQRALEAAVGEVDRDDLPGV